MITKMFNHPRMITQIDEEGFVSDMPIACSVDNFGYVVIEQEGRRVVIAKSSLTDVIKTLQEHKRILHSEKGDE